MSILNPSPYLALQDGVGQPLNNGYIYVGVANQDPQAHPQQVYMDAALTQPLAQPLRTVYGRVYLNGTPAQIYLANNYSIQVLDSKKNTIFYSLNVAQAVDNPVPVNQGGTGATTQFGALVNLGVIAAMVQQTYTAYLTGGNLNHFTLTTTPAIIASPENTRFAVTFHVAGGATPDLNIDGIGAKPLMQYTGAGTTTAAVIALNQKTDIIDAGTYYLVLDPLGAGSGGGGSGTVVSVRQSVLNGPTDSNGLPSWLIAGTGLQIDIALGTPAVPVELAFATGFSTGGTSDLVTTLSASAPNQFGPIPANATTFLFEDFTTTLAATGSNTQQPWQAGYAFDRSKNLLCHFDGTNGQTSATEDWGNVITLVGGATLSTSAPFAGTACLALNGSGQYAQSTQATNIGNGSWFIEGRFKFAALPSNTSMVWFNFNGGSTAQLPLTISLANAGATTKTQVFASSSGSSSDIFNSANGIKTAWVTGQYYHVYFCYDAVAGKYFLHIDGVMDLTTTTTLRLFQPAAMVIGHNGIGGFIDFNGSVDEVRFGNYCPYPNGVTFAPPAAGTAYSVNQAGFLACWFDRVNKKMFEVTGPSATGGVNPTFTQRQRLFVGEADGNNLGGIAAIRTAAYQLQYQSPVANFVANTPVTFNHNIGLPPELVRLNPLARQFASQPWFENAQGVSTFNFNAAANVNRNQAIIAPPAAMQANTSTNGGLTVSSTAPGQLMLIAKGEL